MNERVKVAKDGVMLLLYFFFKALALNKAKM